MAQKYEEAMKFSINNAYMQPIQTLQAMQQMGTAMISKPFAKTSAKSEELEATNTNNFASNLRNLEQKKSREE